MKTPSIDALIIAAGDLPPAPLVRKLTRKAGLVVCADGGARHAMRLGITPDVILGDLDSLGRAARRHFRALPVIFISDQDSTDLEKAVEFCIGRHFRSIHAVGTFGSRIDHTTGSLGCFRKFAPRILLTLYDREGVLSLLPRRARFETAKGERLSLIPLERSEGITTKNLRYALKDGVLELGVREGISNEATAATAAVSYRKGTLLLYRFHRAAKPRGRRS